MRKRSKVQEMARGLKRMFYKLGLKVLDCSIHDAFSTPSGENLQTVRIVGYKPTYAALFILSTQIYIETGKTFDARFTVAGEVKPGSRDRMAASSNKLKSRSVRVDGADFELNINTYIGIGNPQPLRAGFDFFGVVIKGLLPFLKSKFSRRYFEHCNPRVPFVPSYNSTEAAKIFASSGQDEVAVYHHFADPILDKLPRQLREWK